MIEEAVSGEITSGPAVPLYSGWFLHSAFRLQNHTHSSGDPCDGSNNNDKIGSHHEIHIGNDSLCGHHDFLDSNKNQCCHQSHRDDENLSGHNHKSFFDDP